MATLALPNSLEDALGRNPIEFPFGFYIEDTHKGSVGGGFFWFKTEKELQYADKFDVILKNYDLETACAEAEVLVGKFIS